MLQESTKQPQIYISSQGKYLTAPNLSHINLSRFPCQNRTAVRPLLPHFPCPQSAVWTVPYGPKTVNGKQKSVPEISQFPCQIHTTIRTVWTVRNRMDCTDPYSTAFPTAENPAPTKHKILLGFVPKNSWETCPLSSLKLPQKFSLNLLLSMCLAHYPMHSFINLKMTFSLQSVFSPSPTLNPKAKIRSCLLQDQGS